MAGERKESYSYRNGTVHLAGPEIKVGDQAPAFIALAQDFSEVSAEMLQGKVTVFAAVPSLDTGVCDAETKRFNDEAAQFGDQVNFVTVSCDLPFAQRRWCGMTNVDKVKILADHRDHAFGQATAFMSKKPASSGAPCLSSIKMASCAMPSMFRKWDNTRITRKF